MEKSSFRGTPGTNGHWFLLFLQVAGLNKDSWCIVGILSLLRFVLLIFTFKEPPNLAIYYGIELFFTHILSCPVFQFSEPFNKGLYSHQ